MFNNDFKMKNLILNSMFGLFQLDLKVSQIF